MTAPENGETVADEIRCDRCAKPLRGASRPDRMACRCTAEAIAAWRQAGRPGRALEWLRTPPAETEERRVPRYEAPLALEPMSTETINLREPRGWGVLGEPINPANYGLRRFPGFEPVHETVEEQFDELADCVKGLDWAIRGVVFVVGVVAGLALSGVFA